MQRNSKQMFQRENILGRIFFPRDLPKLAAICSSRRKMILSRLCFSTRMSEKVELFIDLKFAVQQV